MNPDKVGSPHRTRRSWHVRLSSGQYNSAGSSLNISLSAPRPIGEMQADLIAPARIEHGVKARACASQLRNVISDLWVWGYG